MTFQPNVLLAVDLVHLNLARQKRDDSYSWFADTKATYFHLPLFFVIHLTISGTGPILLSRVWSIFHVSHVWGGGEEGKALWLAVLLQTSDSFAIKLLVYI